MVARSVDLAVVVPLVLSHLLREERLRLQPEAGDVQTMPVVTAADAADPEAKTDTETIIQQNLCLAVWALASCPRRRRSRSTPKDW